MAELMRTTNGRPPAAALISMLCLLAGPARAAPLEIAATIFPIYDIARQVAGPVADAILVLPPGASPHTFEPSPAGIHALGGARALFAVGHGLDDWAARLARGAGVPHVVTVDTGIVLRRSGDGRSSARIDPHYWMSASNGKRIATAVARELERLAPERRAELERLLGVYLTKLDAADREIRRILADLPTRRIATVHDAFGYFAEAYGLEVAAVFEPYPGLEPSPRFVIEFEKKIRASGIRVVFTEPQLSLAALRPIARDLGVTLGMLDPIGGLPGRESYVDLLLFDARAVAAAARGRAS